MFTTPVGNPVEHVFIYADFVGNNTKMTQAFNLNFYMQSGNEIKALNHDIYSEFAIKMGKKQEKQKKLY